MILLFKILFYRKLKVGLTTTITCAGGWHRLWAAPTFSDWVQSRVHGNVIHAKYLANDWNNIYRQL